MEAPEPITNDHSPGDKLRYVAELFDYMDHVRGVTDRTEIQDDLRAIADYLDEKGYEL